MQKSTAMTRMKTKDFFGLLEKDDKVNWAHQTKLLKKLMGKFSDGDRDPSVKTLKKLSKYFNVPMDKLLK